MTKLEQKQQILEFVSRGEEIAQKEYNASGYIPHISGPLFEAWMNEINIFNERYLKDHPLYSHIRSTYFHHKAQITSHKFMMGHLSALASDTEYWKESPTAPPVATSGTKLKGEVTAMTPIIFISHRTEDSDVADMLRDYLTAVGIPNEYFFCSSLPGNDVNSVISREVKEKIANSSVNIAILSRGYYESAYCINEAGIIWLQDPKVPAIVVGLPEISHTNMLGFLNGDYKLRRLDDLGDISSIYDTIRKIAATAVPSLAVATSAGQKLVERYKAFVSNRESKGVPPKGKPVKEESEEDKRPLPPLEQIKKLLLNPEEWVDEDARYYHSLYPQYTIVIEDDQDDNGMWIEGNRMFYHHMQMDTAAYYGTIKIFCNSTQLFSCQSTDLDGHRMTAPCPEMAFIPYRNYGDPHICLRYYITSELRYLLLRFLEHHIGDANGKEAQIATRRLLEVVLLFDSQDEVEDFVTYIHRHLGAFDSKVSTQRPPHIANETDTAKKVLAKEICNSLALKEMQPEWQQFCYENA